MHKIFFEQPCTSHCCRHQESQHSVSLHSRERRLSINQYEFKRGREAGTTELSNYDKLDFDTFFCAMEFELRAPPSLGKCSKAFYALVILQVESPVFALGRPQTLILLPTIRLPCGWDHGYKSPLPPIFFWFIYSFIHMCIHCLAHLFPMSPAPPPSPLTIFIYLFFKIKSHLYPRLALSSSCLNLPRAGITGVCNTPVLQLRQYNYFF
jgi:hypothetical protein